MCVCVCLCVPGNFEDWTTVFLTARLRRTALEMSFFFIIIIVLTVNSTIHRNMCLFYICTITRCNCMLAGRNQKNILWGITHDKQNKISFSRVGGEEVVGGVCGRV